MEDGSDVEELETAFPAASEDDVISSKLAIRSRRMGALAAIIGLDEETTSNLLRHCGGDEDRMLERYFVDAKGLLREAVKQDTAAVQDSTLESAAAESKEEELLLTLQHAEKKRRLRHAEELLQQNAVRIRDRARELEEEDAMRADAERRTFEASEAQRALRKRQFDAELVELAQRNRPYLDATEHVASIATRVCQRLREAHLLEAELSRIVEDTYPEYTSAYAPELHRALNRFLMRRHECHRIAWLRYLGRVLCDCDHYPVRCIHMLNERLDAVLHAARRPAVLKAKVRAICVLLCLRARAAARVFSPGGAGFIEAKAHFWQVNNDVMALARTAELGLGGTIAGERRLGSLSAVC